MKFIIGLLLIFINVSCLDNSIDNKENMIKSYVEAYNQFDTKKMIQHLDDNIIFQNISNGQLNATTTGINEFKKQAEETKLYFAERKQTITSWDYSGDKVIVQIDYFGILKNDLSLDLKSGDTIKMVGTSEFIFKNDKIIQLIDKS